MSVNMVVLNGKLAAVPENRILDSGIRMMRLLVAVRSEQPNNRLDVLPVVWWEPDDEFVAATPTTGRGVWITGSIQRRFWESADGRRSKIELVAAHVSLQANESEHSESGLALGD